MISEGLADHFAIDPPIWSTALDTGELDKLIRYAMPLWSNTGCNHNKWFFGTGSSIPRWAGYSIGFELVQSYLHQNPGKKASELFDLVAQAFIE
jgi:uncharacterized protein YjaZ